MMVGLIFGLRLPVAAPLRAMMFGEDPIQPRIANIIDGTSNTILVVDAGDHTAVLWTKPDEGIDPDDFSIFDLLGQFPGGFIASWLTDWFGLLAKRFLKMY